MTAPETKTESPPPYIAPTRPIPPPPAPEPGTVAHDDHKIDPLNELAIEVGGINDVINAAVCRRERMVRALTALHADRRADHRRIAELERDLAAACSKPVEAADAR